MDISTSEAPIYPKYIGPIRELEWSGTISIKLGLTEQGHQTGSKSLFKVGLNSLLM